MFELSVAGKYLTPKWRQLSVSIISIISILVIALVVWLIVVFFSVTNGLEKSWIHKLVALTAPARITPTDEYYSSYYYLSDSLSSSSDYTLKSLGEKKASTVADPYDPSIDEEIPHAWPKPDLDDNGELKDLVKLAYAAASSIQENIRLKDFEMTAGHLNLRLVRSPLNPGTPPQRQLSYQTATLSQSAYLGSFDPDNHWLAQAIVPLTIKDAENLLRILELADFKSEDGSISYFAEESQNLKDYFTYFDIRIFKTLGLTMTLPRRLLPHQGTLTAWAVYNNDKLLRLILPKHAYDQPASLQQWGEEDGYRTTKVRVEFRDQQPFFAENHQEFQPIPKNASLALADDIAINAIVDDASLQKARKPSDVLFNIQVRIQDVLIEGKLPYKNLEIVQAEFPFKPDHAAPASALWVNSALNVDKISTLQLPSHSIFGEGVLLPKSFQDVGVAVGDRGSLSYAAPTTSSVQEQQIPIFVAGFYEPGVIPTGGKIILVNQDVTSLIRSSINQDETPLTNGINVRFDRIEKADDIKHKLEAALSEKGISKYWKVETYRDYEFTKDLIKQLQSEKNLFMLLATVIILVACSNIISMLIILVNDKKMEIGILRSMGATSGSIAIIFGSCGVFMGMLGSLLGIFAAVLTLKNLSFLVNLISRIQGHEMFNPIYFGQYLPTELSYEALAFVIAATTLISLIAGLVPAVKASLMRPSTILRSE